MIAAVVPLKRLSDAKSRLAPALTVAERRALVLNLLDGVLAAVRQSGVAARIALVTPEPDMATQHGVEALPDAGDLNASLCVAARWATSIGAETLIILPADLPLIGPADVAALLAALPTGPGIALAPTADGGTGGLALRPPTVIAPQFGACSFIRHLEEAARRGVAAQPIPVPGLSRDLDVLDDLDLLQARGTTDGLKSRPLR